MYLQKHLKSNFSLPIRERGSAIFGSGLVSAISGNQWSARATVQGAVLYKVALHRVKELVRASGSETSGLSTEQTRAKVRAESAMWAKVVKSTGIKVE